MINQFYKYKIGSGFDFHRISKTNKENKIALCGLHIPANFQIIAHSDGDVGLHALTEAILGSVAAGNIGQTFPSSDSRFKNADSSLFLLHAIDILLQQNASIVNIDITFICEIPQI
ncbi:MAG: 2-C-methyl-D-erythritol 2,4-cyclodiphosphate synthase, partial [Proteobacteria bacterium]|nr:2-C-methyl-D-erythritol 2,4-cyclodiphosphate synthase [Pseudomonadota bacterium]